MWTAIIPKSTDFMQQRYIHPPTCTLYMAGVALVIPKLKSQAGEFFVEVKAY